MGKSATLIDDDLFARAERVRRDSEALARELVVLRELRTLERDFLRVTFALARVVRAMEPAELPEEWQRVLAEAQLMLQTR